MHVSNADNYYDMNFYLKFPLDFFENFKTNCESIMLTNYRSNSEILYYFVYPVLAVEVALVIVGLPYILVSSWIIQLGACCVGTVNITAFMF